MSGTTAVDDVDEQPTEPDDTADDLGALLAEPDPMTIAGVPCQVRRIKTREFLALVRVLMDGLGPGAFGLMDGMREATDSTDLAERMTAAFMLAAPRAPDAVVNLVRALVEPTLSTRRRPESMLAFEREMSDPDIDVVLDVVEHVVHQEGEALWSLLGKAREQVERIGMRGRAVRPSSGPG